jgi:hypothetical protein
MRRALRASADVFVTGAGRVRRSGESGIAEAARQT